MTEQLIAQAMVLVAGLAVIYAIATNWEMR